MIYWCKKHKRPIPEEEARGRCLKENCNDGCVNLTQKRRRKIIPGLRSLRRYKPISKEPRTEKEWMPIEEKRIDKIEYALYQAGLLPINDKTERETILQKAIDDQWELFQCLMSARAKVTLVLRSGAVIKGSLYKIIGQGYKKLRVKIGESNDKHGIGTFVDTWPRQVVATGFELTTDFNGLGFKPYLEKQMGTYYDTSWSDLNEIEGDLFWDVYDVLTYLFHGKYCVERIRITLINGMEFIGSLEFVGNDRALLFLGNTGKLRTYLDAPLMMISAIQFEVGAKGWPHAPD